jgi:hypothetical protein
MLFHVLFDGQNYAKNADFREQIGMKYKRSLRKTMLDVAGCFPFQRTQTRLWKKPRIPPRNPTCPEHEEFLDIASLLHGS